MSRRHRSLSPMRDFWVQVGYLLGRIGLLVLLLLVAVVLMVGAIVVAAFMFIWVVQGYVGD